MNSRKTKVAIRLLLYILITLGSSTLQAQHGLQLFQKADSLLKLSQLDSAEFYLTSAAKAFRSEGKTVRYFDAKTRLFDIINARQQFDQLKEKTASLLSELKASDKALPAHFARTYRKIGAIEEFYHGNLNGALTNYKKGLSYYNTSENGKPDIVFAELLKDHGLILSYMSQTDSARVYLQNAIELITEFYPKNLMEKADMKSLFAMTYYFDFNPRQALIEIKKAMQVLDDIESTRKVEYSRSDQYSQLTEIFIMAGYYDSAIYALDKRQALENSFSEQLNSIQAQILIQRANISGLKGDMRQAMIDIRKAISICSEVLGPNHMLTAQSYTYLAQYMLQNHGALEQAEGYLKRVYSIYLNTYGPNHTATATALLEIGNLYLQTDNYPRALEYFTRALRIQKNNGLDGQIAQLKDLIADTYIRMGEFSLALEMIEESIATYTRIYGAEHEFIGDIHTLRAAAFKGLGNPDLALEEFQKAETIYTQVFGPKHQKIADLFYQKSLISQMKNDLTTSLQWVQEAIISNSYKFESIDLDKNPEPNDFISAIDMFRYLRLKANLLRSSSAGTTTLQSVQKVYDLTMRAMEELSKEHRKNKDILSLNSFYRNVYDDGINNLFELYELAPTDELGEKMFSISEQAKARALELNHSQRKARSFANLPKALLAHELKLLEEISYVKSRLLMAETMEEEQRKYFENRLFKAEREKEKLLDQLENDYEDYFELKYQTSVYPVKEIQKNLKPREAYLEYHLTGNALYAFLITQQDFEIKKTELPDNFDSLAFRFSKAIRSRQQEEYLKSGNALYHYTIAPLEGLREIQKITILPDRSLWAINFDLLPSNNSTTPEYLIEQYAVSYAYSAALLFDQQSVKNANNKLLAFSYEDENNGGLVSLNSMRDDNLNKIPGTAREIAALAEIMDGDYYYGSAARESEFKQKAHDYSILHLALHGEVDYKNSDNSKLYFSGPPSDSVEDAILYPFELYNMSLNADLAVLSACETGAGRIASGEGIMSLGRAFQYAGVQSLLLSQWEVSDPVSPVIMASFYENLKAGKNKAEALRQAKLSFLKSANNVAANPYYWGGFFILGNTEPVTIKQQNRFISYLLPTLVLIFIFTGLRIRRKRNTNP